MKNGRITLKTVQEMAAAGEPIAMLTAYDFHTARVLAKAGVPTVLVGDSAAMTVLGLDSTTGITLDFLVTITAAVRRGAPDVFLMADMPFGSYANPVKAVENAARFVREAGADAVKLECDGRHAEIVKAMAAAGITTCAHLGLLPQRAHQMGGYVAQGRTKDDAKRIVEDAVKLYEAGALMILLEAVPDDVTKAVVGAVKVPVIGCGAGPSAHGHVVVVHDMLGYSERVPRFVEKLGDVPGAIEAAARKYVERVVTRKYPAAEHQYQAKK